MLAGSAPPHVDGATAPLIAVGALALPGIGNGALLLPALLMFAETASIGTTRGAMMDEFVSASTIAASAQPLPSAAHAARCVSHVPGVVMAT